MSEPTAKSEWELNQLATETANIVTTRYCYRGFQQCHRVVNIAILYIENNS